MDDAHRAKLARQLGLLRFAIIGDLLAAPPPRGELTRALRALSEKTWRMPDGQPVRFGLSTIEQWYYQARHATDPVAALTSEPRSDRGSRRAMDEVLLGELRRQYELHPSWTVRLHAQNLAAIVRERYRQTHTIPSYPTVRRAMRAQGWNRQRRPRTEGEQAAVERKARRETRGFEVTHAHALWHFDFHHGSRRVVDRAGRWHTPILLAFLDDRTRVVPHAQWYLSEDAERLVDGFCQAVLKRGLPRAVLHDNGSAMRSAEFLQGLEDLGVKSKPTLAYSPEQNGKMETFWAVVESRIVALLERVEQLDLQTLNRATQAWVECDYHRTLHENLGETPLDRLESSPGVARPAPSLTELRFQFTQRKERSHRLSDGTVSIEGVRFEVPSRLRALRVLTVRFRRWDLSEAWVVDPRTEDVLARIVPVDLAAHADGRRRALKEPSVTPRALDPDEDPFPPRLRELLADYAADGLPPAYIPKDEDQETP